MSGISSITRDWGGDAPAIVRITTGDTISAASAANYILNQNANIQLANNGNFEWLVSDMCLVYCSNGWFFGSISSDFKSLNPLIFSTTVVGAPVVIGDFAVFASTGGNIKDLGYLPSNSAKTSVVMANAAVTANHIAVFTDTAGTIGDDAATAINLGNIQAGASGSAGTLISYPGTASEGSLIVAAVNNSGGNFSTTVSNASSVGQNQVVSIPDSGASTANFLLDKGTGAAIAVNNLKYGATPVAQVDPASCTITAAAGATNTATVTIQLKDGSGTNMGSIIPFRVYSSSASNGLTLASAASTGYSVASGGLSLSNGTAVTTQISCMSSATGGCVLSLLDTAKQTSYLVLVLANGVKISAQLSAGSYG